MMLTVPVVHVIKGTQEGEREGGKEGRREGGRKGGREKQQIPPAVDFPQVPLVIMIMLQCTYACINLYLTSL